MKILKIFLLILTGLLGLNVGYSNPTHSCTDVASFSAARDSTGFKLASVLQSHMVIQQAKPLRLWGTAQAGATVRILADWHKEAVTALADSYGKWIVQLPVPAAVPGNFESHRLSLVVAEDTITLTDLLIGDVWLCSGQSNMDMEMKANLPWLEGVIDYEKEIAVANYPSIRFINIENKFTKTPIEQVNGRWQVVSPKNAGELSGVAYYFARELLGKVQVPIGLVVSSFGGSTAQAWTGRDMLEADPVLKGRYLDSYDNSPQAAESLDSIQTLEKMFEVLARPALLYNAMIYPIRNLSIRGFLWYQGESNRYDGSMYTRLNAAMIEGWRKDFSQGELPFYYVQMTPYNWEENDPNATYYAELREAQEAVLKQVKNTGMAVTMDIGEVANIHPRNKKDVSVRLSKLALYHTYGFKDTKYMGPTLRRFKVRGPTVKVDFEVESIGSGLTTSDRKAPKHFYLAGKDGVFHQAQALIVNNQVLLKSEKVRKPVAVRYAFTNYPITNFCNKEGLPAMPFRTDQWSK